MKKWLLALCCVLVLGGCAPRTKVIEDIQLIQAIGYDYVNKNEFRSVAGSLIVLPSEETLPQTKVFTATGNTSRITQKKMQAKSSKYMVVGRIGLMLFQDRLAEDGIFYFLNVHQRDSMIGRNLRPAIVEGKTFDLLSKNYQLDTTVYQYLNELLEQSEREIY
ncbi:Ger(x)C family spore germination protein, partial [Shouchella clausii]